MASPNSKATLKEYCLRQLGKPVIEINVDDDQVDDLLDDTIQLFNERVYDGVERMYLKYKLTENDITNGGGGSANAGRNETVTATDSNDGASGTSRTLNFEQGRGYLTLPDHIIGVEGIKKVSNTMVNNMFGFRYQFFLNDFYNFYAYDILNMEITLQYLETLNFLIEGNKDIRYNKVTNRLYIDIDWDLAQADDYIVIDCYRALDPTTFTKVYNERFVKKYATAKIKKQWGQNLIKFTGIKMPGGVEFNGRQIYDDATQELTTLEEQMLSTYETPPLDFVG
jgi:hypothetical protein|tara:strand:+ start:4986 stop:5831 length:846 start_codon:yes stop_codon:yes gene_type:complete